MLATRVDGYPAMTTGYLPTLEYLNYVLPALMLRASWPVSLSSNWSAVFIQPA